MPCLVFIDEVDALFGARSNQQDGDSSARLHSSILTQFMQEMDGLISSKVIVIGATNRPFDLDDAILRRLPCRILIDLPDPKAREQILKIILRDEQLGPDITLEELAKKTDHFSGSDLRRKPFVKAYIIQNSLTFISLYFPIIGILVPFQICALLLHWSLSKTTLQCHGRLESLCPHTKLPVRRQSPKPSRTMPMPMPIQSYLPL